MNHFKRRLNNQSTQLENENQIILPFEEVLVALDYFKSIGYAALGFEVFVLNDAKQLKVVKQFVPFFSDVFIWNEVVYSSYMQVKEQIKKEDNTLILTVDASTIFYGLICMNQDQFKTYYYHHFHVK